MARPHFYDPLGSMTALKAEWRMKRPRLLSTTTKKSHDERLGYVANTNTQKTMMTFNPVLPPLFHAVNSKTRIWKMMM